MMDHSPWIGAVMMTVMGVFWLALLALIVLGVVWLVRALTGHRYGGHAGSGR